MKNTEKDLLERAGIPHEIRVWGKILCMLLFKTVDIFFMQDDIILTGNALCVHVCVCAGVFTCTHPHARTHAYVDMCGCNTLACCVGSFYSPTLNLFMGL